jgi:hypothetical protein
MKVAQLSVVLFGLKKYVFSLQRKRDKIARSSSSYSSSYSNKGDAI